MELGSKHSLDTRRKISEKTKVAMQSNIVLNKIRGRKKSVEHLRKMVETRKRLNIRPMLGKKHSDEARKKISISKNATNLCKGKNHYNWKGGISINKHSTSEPKYKKWRSSVFERDGWTCQTCGVKGCYLEAHHIKSWARYPELRYVLDNGVTLCRECHKLTDNYKGRNKKL